MKARLLCAAAVCGVIATSSVAIAQNDAKKQAALDLFQQGKVKYDLGQWEKAIQLFQQSYEAYPAATLLFNIAQSNRHWGKCKEALFFYRRYLAEKPDAENKDEVEGFIAELEEGKSCTEPTTTQPTDPSINTGGTTTAGTTTTGTTTGSDVGGGDLTAITDGPFRPSMIVTMVEAGPAFLGLGPDFDNLVQFSITAGAGYPLPVGPVTIIPGAMLSYTRVPWEDPATEEEGTSSLISVLANGTMVYPVWQRLSVRGSVGLGVQVLTGVAESGNVFIQPGMAADGALSMFNVRGAVGAEYGVTDNLVVSLHPLVYSYSPARAGMLDSIDAITRLEILAGIGYQL